MYNPSTATKSRNEFRKNEKELEKFVEGYQSHVARLFSAKTRREVQQLADDIAPFVSIANRWNFDPVKQRCLKPNLQYVRRLEKGLEERAVQLKLGEIKGVDMRKQYPTLASLAEEFGQKLEPINPQREAYSEKEKSAEESGTAKKDESLEAMVLAPKINMPESSLAEEIQHDDMEESVPQPERQKEKKPAAEPAEQIIRTASSITLKDVGYFFECNGLVGEAESRLISTLGAIKKMAFGYVSLSGSGKSKTTYLLKDMFPNGSMYIMELSSGTAETYEADTINQHEIIFIPELQKALESGNQIIKEILKNVTEGREGIRKVRNAGKGVNEVYTIRGDIGVIFAMTPEHKYDSEFSRRVFVLQTDISPEQNRRVINSIAGLAHAKKKRKTARFDKLTQHIGNCLKLNGQVEYEIPCAEYISGFIPDRTVRARSYANYLFSMINASAQFHHGERMFDDNILFAGIADVHLIMERLFWRQYMKGLLGIPIAGEETLSIFQQHKDVGMTADEVYFKLNEINQDINEKVAETILNSLTRTGFIYKDRKGNGGAKYMMRGEPPNLELTGFSMQKCLEDSLEYIAKEYGKPAANKWLEMQVTEGNRIVAYDPFGGPDRLLAEVK